ncbi:hypothetical protein [Streptomyces sp. NPDC046821]|uniref:hypothetical protein n=1 Tax=Streptomyces sp. NPDC046821 TaxID=3154702 RepID=UPI0033F67FEB
MPSLPKLLNSLEQGKPHSRLRLSGLLTVVVLTVLLPLAGASAGPVRDSATEDILNSGTAPARRVAEVAGTTGNSAIAGAGKIDDKPGGATGGSPAKDSGQAATDNATNDGTAHRHPAGTTLIDGLGIVTTARCGPELSSPDGIEAQTCVLTQGRETWARTYYRNATGAPLSSVLTLMAPAGRTVQMHCAVGARDEPGTCDTPRERTSGGAGDYSAVAEFAGAGDEGPLLLRSGSNAATPEGH